MRTQKGLAHAQRREDKWEQPPTFLNRPPCCGVCQLAGLFEMRCRGVGQSPGCPPRGPEPPARPYLGEMAGEIDPMGTRKEGLDAFLDEKLAEGFTIETRTDTHAIISRRPKALRRFTGGADPGRFVVEVDEDGRATMRHAEPRRS